jgi:hypothetical protein
MSGDYLVTLKFADNVWTQAGQWVFNVAMEGKVVVSELDVMSKMGPKAAYGVTLPVTVTDGGLNIGLQSVVGNPIMNALKDTVLVVQYNVLIRPFGETGEDFLNWLVVGIFFRFHDMEDTYATRLFVSRFHYFGGSP